MNKEQLDLVLKNHLKYIIEKENGINRWSLGLSHHPESIALMKFIAEIDEHVYDCAYDWKCRGDGEGGEVLMYQFDAFFEAKDAGSI